MNRKNVESITSLAPAQQGMLYETIRAPKSGIHIEQSVRTITGSLHLPAFVYAWEWAIKRHAVLRTSFVWKDQPEPLQVVLREVALPLQREDWRELSPEEQQERLERYLREDRQRGFVLAQAPLMRLALFQLADEVYRSIWTFHHILMDGWCHKLILREVLACYEAASQGKDFSLAPSRPYREYIAWLKRQDLGQAEQFWRKLLHGIVRPTALSRAQASSPLAEPTQLPGAVKHRLSAETTAALQRIARRRHLTINTLLQGVWALLLSHYSGEQDVVFGITVSGRPAELSGVETMVGLFINTLPLRLRLDSTASWWNWLSEVQALNLEMRQYEYSPAGQVHGWSEMPGHLPLFESLLVVENYPTQVAQSQTARSDVSLSDPQDRGAQTTYALTFLVSVTTRLTIECVYHRQRITEEGVRQLLGHVEQVLEHLASDPEESLADLQALLSGEQAPLMWSPWTENQEPEVSEVRAPRTPIEEVVAALWRELLGLEQISVQDNFFERGGHSLLATQLLARLRSVMQIELPLRSLFEAPTVAGLAERVTQALHQGHKRAYPPLLPASRDQTLPLSFAQQRLWFLDQLEPGNAAYNIFEAVRLSGPLKIVALEESLGEVIQRHESLRTTFQFSADQPVQLIADAEAFSLPQLDLSLLSPQTREQVARQLSLQEARAPFDLSRGPLLRAWLIRLSPQEHVLLVNMHHIISDGWSMGVFVREVTTLYQAAVSGQAVQLPPLPIQYADFALWQRNWLQGVVLDDQLAYWRKQLAGLEPLELPTDHPRPAVQTFHGARQSLRLPAELSEELRQLSQREGVTLFMTLLAAFQLLLARYSGQSDIAIGTPIANRTHAEIEGLIGFFANTLVLRTDLSETPNFRELLQQVREVCLGAYAHQDVPFEKLVEALQPERDQSRSPLFQVLLNMGQVARASEVQTLNAQGLTLSRLALEGEAAKFDLSLAVNESAQSLYCVMEYNTDLFEESTVCHLLEHWHCLLRAVVAQPQAPLSRLPLLSEKEEQLLQQWSPRQTNFPVRACLHERFERQAAATPDAIALVWQEQQVSYGTLDAFATRLAQRLRACGVGPERLVGLCLSRSVELLIGLLAILKAGGAYVPLDPAAPAERLAFQLNDAHIDLVLTERSLRKRDPFNEVERFVLCLDDAAVWATVPEMEMNSRAMSVPEQAAYVIYTSGSTGQPKGMVISHANVVRLFAATTFQFGMGPGEVWSGFHSVAFDFSVWELWGAWLTGGRLCLVSEEMRRSPQQFVELLQEQAVTVLSQTPSAFQQLIWAEQSTPKRVPLAVRWVIFGGEALDARRLEPWVQMYGLEQPQLINMYGITETTVHVTVHPVEPGDLGRAGRGSVIGRALADLDLYVLDAQMQPVPIGMVGELYVGGAGVGRGYLGRAELTAARLVPHPWSERGGERLYRSGDLGRWRRDGRVEYVGRADEQIKLRGYRIELGEIESVLQRHPAVRACVVLLQEASSGDRRLVAYVVRAAGENGELAELRAYMQQRLPDYMVPAFFVPLAALPLTANGKLDRRALPAPSILKEEDREDEAIDQSPIEEIVINIWKEVLEIEQADRQSNFFAQGGHSLLATQLVARLRTSLGVEISLRNLFEAPTIAGVCMQVERALRGKQQWEVPPLLPVSRTQPIPLSFAQQRLWFLDRLQPGSATYNLPNAVRLHGKLNTMVLERCLEEIASRHESLRTTFRVEDNQPVQIIRPVSTFCLPVIDLGALSYEERNKQVQQQANKEAVQPFDLINGPVWRALILRLDENEHVLLVTMHHIVADAWSLNVFVHEVTVLYEALTQGKPSPLAPLTIQYADFAAWQRNWLQGEILDTYIDYWKKQLRGAVPLELPFDHPRPSLQSYRGANYSFTFPEDLSKALVALSHQETVTLFMTLLAAFQTLIYRYTNQTDITIGTDLANRKSVETESLIGFFVNLLVLRANLSGALTFRQWLHQVRDLVLESYTYQDIPFDMLVEHLRIDRKTNQTPLVQILFVLQNVPRSQIELPDLKLNPFAQEITTAKFDMALFMREGHDGLRCMVNYSTDLFEASTISNLMSRFEVLLHSIVAQPDTPIDALNIYSEHERIQKEKEEKEKVSAIRAKIMRSKGKEVHLK